MKETRSLTPDDVRRYLPARPSDSHKGSFGRVVAVCGSVGMSGAAYLCGLAAYRTGCGLVEIVTPEKNRTILQTQLPEAIVTAYSPDDRLDRVVSDAVRRADAVVVGCGLGRGETSVEVLKTVLASLRVPAVIDADALNIISEQPALFDSLHVPVVVTPHPFEMSRLTRLPVEKVCAEAQTVAESFAVSRKLVCVLKGHRTIISDSKTTYINQFGNSGMATGGSGDVLAGVIASLLSQARRSNMSLVDIAALGVLIHSLAGDAAANELGEYAMMASDIISHLGQILR